MGCVAKMQGATELTLYALKKGVFLIFDACLIEAERGQRMKAKPFRFRSQSAKLNTLGLLASGRTMA
jgi:hypothetical protein